MLGRPHAYMHVREQFIIHLIFSEGMSKDMMKLYVKECVLLPKHSKSSIKYFKDYY
jgi:hypothetical protein